MRSLATRRGRAVGRRRRTCERNRSRHASGTRAPQTRHPTRERQCRHRAPAACIHAAGRLRRGSNRVLIGGRARAPRSESTRSMQPVRYSLRVVAPSLAVAIMGLVAACGDSDKGASETLPPISTTTTTTTLAATTTTVPDFYIIQKGDSLFAIAQKFGLNFTELAAFNGIANPDSIQAGQKLRIPKPGDAIPTTVAPPAAPSTT